jgi:hypothetical protein
MVGSCRLDVVVEFEAVWNESVDVENCRAWRACGDTAAETGVNNRDRR